jgi:ATP-dependent helicase/nuclease subunit A
MIHKLLEILPDLGPERRREIASDYLEAQPHMSAALKTDITDTVFGVLDAPEFASLFGAGSRAEVSLAGTASGLPEGIYMNAQIDRLAVTGHEVWIVDYKSNRPPPMAAEQVSEIYIAQMAAYRALAREIYPKHVVRCALLWTDVPVLMELPEDRLDRFDLRAAILGSAP